MNAALGSSVALACVAPLLFGYTLGFTSPGLMPMEISADAAVFDASITASGIVSSSASTFGALVNIGAMAGAVLAVPISDGTGRRGAIAACAIVWAISWFWLGATRELWQVLTARFLTGVGVGIASGSVPVYIAEVAPASIRGTLGALNQLGVVVGILFVYALGYVRQHEQRSTVRCEASDEMISDDRCDRIASTGWTCVAASSVNAEDDAERFCVGSMAGWVELAWTASATACLLLLGALTLLPETPPFLTSKGRVSEARRVADLLGAGGASAPPPTSAEAPSTAPRGSEGGGACGALRAPELRAPLCVACGLMLTQQLSGINAVIFYSSDILLRAGIGDANLGGLFIMAIQVGVTGLCSVLVDRAGRRPLLLASLGGMTLAATALAVFFANPHAPSWLALAALVAYIVSFSLGLGALPWLIMGEIFPGDVRAAASSLATMINWSCSFLVTLSFSAAASALGPAAVFVIFAAICTAGSIFIMLYLPETKGVPLDEVQTLFAGEKGKLSSVNTESKVLV